ncbi:MAG: AraC family transcriptional regulator [Gallionella sp.]|nr:AraC family transcriptional regulator [Gallionella sp.]MDD4946892.1 AraC family transcriptional regulator [Gallionella sp.]
MILLATKNLKNLTVSIKMDRLSPLFSRFTLTARVFYSGNPCGSFDFGAEDGVGYLHILRRGEVFVIQPGCEPSLVTEPSVIFYPRPRPHRFHVQEGSQAEIICTTIDFGAGLGNPLINALPEVLIIPLSHIAELAPMLSLFFDEAFAERCGRQAAVNRLAEYFLVLLLRHTIDAKLIGGGMISGLSDAKLSKAITAMHERPEHVWSLEELAQTANMSRARFAVLFRETVGTTPLDYLTDWRISVAQTLLKSGKPLKLVAPEVGYSHPVALTRVFTKRVGLSPKKWMEHSKTVAA